MRRLTNKEMRVLIEQWQSLMPLRPLTYGEHLSYAREQAYYVRALAQTNEPAINLASLRDQEVIPVVPVPAYVLSEGSGLTSDRPDGKLRIYLNQNEPELRQRFTLLHEFKHALDFFSSGVLYQQLGMSNAEKRDTQIEAVANEFAAHVLMPTDLVKQVWFDTRDIEMSARAFRVSVEAMARRLHKLGLDGVGPSWRRDFFAMPGTKLLDHCSNLACAT
jgi:hypothetical protein